MSLWPLSKNQRLFKESGLQVNPKMLSFWLKHFFSPLERAGAIAEIMNCSCYCASATYSSFELDTVSRNELIIKALSDNSMFLSFYIYMGEILTDHREKEAGPHKVIQCQSWIVWKGNTWYIYGIPRRTIRTEHFSKWLEINGFYRFSWRYIFSHWKNMEKTHLNLKLISDFKQDRIFF